MICVTRTYVLNPRPQLLGLDLRNQLVVPDQMPEHRLHHHDIVGHVQVDPPALVSRVVFDQVPGHQRVLDWLLELERPFSQQFDRANQADSPFAGAFVENLETQAISTFRMLVREILSARNRTDILKPICCTSSEVTKLFVNRLLM